MLPNNEAVLAADDEALADADHAFRKTSLPQHDNPTRQAISNQLTGEHTMRYKIATYSLWIALACSTAFAQPTRGEGGGGPDMAQLWPVYAALDIDGDGEISAKEIASATASLTKLDKDGDGSLSGDELAPSFGGPRGARSRPGGFGPPGGFGGRQGPPDPDKIFEGLDTNGDGKIAKEEATEQQQSRWDGMDSNKDGYLDEEEQKAAMELLRQMLSGFGGRGGAGGRGFGGRGFGGPPGGFSGRPGGGPPGAGGLEGRAPGGNAVAGAQDVESSVARMMVLDTNQDDKLTREELNQRFHSLFARADKNEDGVITKEELERMFKDQLGSSS